MKKYEVLRNEAAVMLAGAFEQATHGLEFDFSGIADKITKKMLEASAAYWEETYVHE